MTNKSEKLAKALLLPINPAVVVLLGFYTMVWGFWLANPFWTVFTQAALYSELEGVEWMNNLGINPELFWGLNAIFCGGIIIRGALKRNYRPLVIGAATAIAHWGIIAIFYFMGDWHNTGGITASIFAIYGAFLWLNLRVNFKDRHNIDDVLR